MFKEQWKNDLWKSIVSNVQAQKALNTAINFNDDTSRYQAEVSRANMELFRLIESLPSEFREG